MCVCLNNYKIKQIDREKKTANKNCQDPIFQQLKSD